MLRHKQLNILQMRRYAVVSTEVYGEENVTCFSSTSLFLLSCMASGVMLQTSAHLLLWPGTASSISRCGTMIRRLIAASSSSTAAAAAMKTDSARRKRARRDAASASPSFLVLVRKRLTLIISARCYHFVGFFGFAFSNEHYA